MDLSKLNIQPNDHDHVLRERCVIYVLSQYNGIISSEWLQTYAESIYKYIKNGIPPEIDTETQQE